jgi:predicted transcriptional regulator
MRPLLIVAALLALAMLPVATAQAPAVADAHLEAHADAQVTAPEVPTVAPPQVPQLPDPGLPAGLPDASALPSGALPLPEGTLPDAPAPGDVPLESLQLLAPASVPEKQETRSESIARAVLPAAERAAPAAVATVGVLALLQAVGAYRFVAMAGVALYSRLTKSNLLDNEHRDGVYKLIQETPGLGVSQIAAKSGLGWGTTVYHLDRLEREGFVASERGGLHRCYFAVGSIDRATRKAQAATKGDTSASVAALLRERPGITQTELCEALGMSASAASKQISKLETAGLVRREREWKTVRLFPEGGLGAPLAA